MNYVMQSVRGELHLTDCYDVHCGVMKLQQQNGLRFHCGPMKLQRVDLCALRLHADPLLTCVQDWHLLEELLQDVRCKEDMHMSILECLETGRRRSID